MNQWIEIVSRNGIAVLVVFGLGWFVYKELWPLIEKRLADADAREKENLQRWEDQGKMFTETLRQEREEKARRFDEQGKMFMEAIRRQGVLYDQTHKESMKAQGKIADELRRVHEYLRNGNGK